jgi:hypothetical protein
VARKEAEDILLRYNRMDSNSQHFVSSAFEMVLTDLEDQLGSASNWSDEHKKELAKQIMASSKEAFGTRGNNVTAEITRINAHGAALLSLYLELQTLPGNLAKAAVESIDRWRASVK